MFKLVLGKAEEPEIKLPTSAGSSKKQESSKKASISALLTTPKCREPPGCTQSMTRSRDERGAYKAALPHTGLPRGPNMSPRESPGCTQTVTKSRDERGTCKAALPLGVAPGAQYVSFLFMSYCRWAFY